jgi:hypothetical protein
LAIKYMTYEDMADSYESKKSSSLAFGRSPLAFNISQEGDKAYENNKKNKQNK